jgi:hypothetical protein
MLRGTLEPLETVRHTTRPTVSYAVQAQDTSSCQSYSACWCGLQLRFKPVPKGTASPKGFTASPKGILSRGGRGALPPAQGRSALCHLRRCLTPRMSMLRATACADAGGVSNSYIDGTRRGAWSGRAPQSISTGDDRKRGTPQRKKSISFGDPQKGPSPVRFTGWSSRDFCGVVRDEFYHMFSTMNSTTTDRPSHVSKGFE